MDREYPEIGEIQQRYPEFNHDELIPLQLEMRDADEIRNEITNLFKNFVAQIRRVQDHAPLAQIMDEV